MKRIIMITVTLTTSVVFASLFGTVHSFINDDSFSVYLTTGDQSRTLSQQASIGPSPNSIGYSVWVDRRKRRQTIDGFGAALTNSAGYVLFHSTRRHEIINDLFGTNGLHVTYLRMTMGGSDMSAVDPYTYNDLNNHYDTDYNLNHFTIQKDREFMIPVLKEALSINPNLKILATPWSAPAWMKTTHQLNGGALRNEYNVLHTYAQYFLKFIQAYQSEGIPIEAITVQNEPLLSNNEYPTMKVDADLEKTFIRDHLGPLFKQNGISTKIFIFDHNWSDSWYPEQILNDGNAKQYISGVAWHGYGGQHDTPSGFHNKHPDVGMYFTEVTGGDWDTNFASTLVWDTRIVTIGQTRAWAKAVMLWNIALDENHGLGGCSNCRGIITVPNNANYYTKNVEYYSMAHMSRFVQPGAVRLESNQFGWDDLHTAAFVNPDGSTVIVVLNPNSSKSASFSLDIDAKHYHYNNLPPQSVVTFIK